MVVREINKQEHLLQILNFTRYISKSNVIRSASYIKYFEKEAYMWISGFCPHGGSKKTNSPVLKDITSFLSNSTRPSNSTQQWGLKSPKEKLMKDEVINYNEG
jgi:hypothetical protein